MDLITNPLIAAFFALATGGGLLFTQGLTAFVKGRFAEAKRPIGGNATLLVTALGSLVVSLAYARLGWLDLPALATLTSLERVVGYAIVLFGGATGLWDLGQARLAAKAKADADQQLRLIVADDVADANAFEREMQLEAARAGSGKN